MRTQLARLGRLLATDLGMPVTPEQFGPSHLAALLPYLGEAPKTVRTNLGWLSSFLTDQGNTTIRKPILVLKRRFPDVTGPLRRTTRKEFDLLMDHAQGLERVVLALEYFAGFRRVSVMRARCGDVRWDAAKIGIRQKEGYDRVTHWAELLEPLKRELRWYEKLREQWAQGRAPSDYLLVHVDGDRLVPWSDHAIDMMVSRAGERVGIRLANHDLRRGAARTLRERGATPHDLHDFLGHSAKTPDTLAMHYAGEDQENLVRVSRLLEAPDKPVLRAR